VGTWWQANNEVDIVGLDELGRVALTGECKWTNEPFGWSDLDTYLNHVGSMGSLVRPDSTHVLFCKSGFVSQVRAWASDQAAILLDPTEMLAPFAR
jgi:uncharacterized protein